MKKVVYWLLPKGIYTFLKKLHCKIFFKKVYTKCETASNWKKKYVKFVQTEKVEKNWVFYESHAGAGMLCNPLAIFKAFQRSPDFNKYLHIWTVRDEAEKKLLEQEHKHLKNVIFVYYQSEGYAYFVAKSKYLINNTSFYPVFSKRKEQIYMNTWHSITVKALGYDMPDGTRLVSNMLRNLLMSDYVISPNRFMTDIFNNAFRLREIFTNKYLEIGYPRNDLVVNTKREEILSKMERRGTVVDRNRKIILYAPTWTGTNVGRPVIDVGRYTAIYEHFSKNVDMSEYQLLIKPHNIEYRNFTQEERNSGKYVSYTIDANELLSVVDILITDYSSIYFDYMTAKKPILFYMPDFEAYNKMRGIYFTKDELPGPCCFDLKSLAECVNNIEQVITDYKEICDNTRAWACEFDDGKVSEKALDVLFNENCDYNIKTAPKTDKTRILMYIGTLATNGVTSAALSLLNAIDYEKYDVSVFVVSLKNEQQNSNFDKINPNVRVILRNSAPTLTKEDKVVYNQMRFDGIPTDKTTLEHLKRIMQREYMRLFGEAKFDYIIDFSGYSPYFPALAFLGNQNANTKCFMWQHNDMLLDYTNEEKKALNNNAVTVDALKSCYRLCDKVVSATEDVYKINKKNFATSETIHKFTYATNQMDSERIEALLNDENVEITENSLIYTNQQFDNGIKNHTVIPFKKQQMKFVTMGRCMPEKNHQNIIHAIKRLVDNGYDAVLYIIGDGHLRSDLEALAEKLGVADRIFITGVMQNPIALLKCCDCFIFPSIYEAQGLAVLEARTVGLPIIVSNYEAVGSVLMEDKQYILKGTDVDSVYEGMLAYINGQVPSDYKFDIAQYNKHGMEEFEKLFD